MLRSTSHFSEGVRCPSEFLWRRRSLNLPHLFLISTAAFQWNSLILTKNRQLGLGYMGMCGEDSQLVSFLRRTSLFQIGGFLSAIVGWCLCIAATSVGQWRLWHIDKSTQFPSGVMWIGIWDVCYDTNSPDVDDYDINCKPFDAGHAFLPKEIFLAQDLMPLCALVETLALGFFFLAYWNIIENENKRKITLTFFAIGGFLSFTSGIVVFIPVVWNMLSVLNNEKINFPESFDMPSNPKFQYVGVAIHLGLASGLLQILSGLIFLSNKYLLIHKKTHPLDCEKGPEIPMEKTINTVPIAVLP